jgi:putative DNA primase/helicase
METGTEFTCAKCRQIKKGKKWAAVQGRGSPKIWKDVCTDCRAELTGERPRPSDALSISEGDKRLHDKFFLTDAWNAVELQEDHGKDVLYCRKIDKWFAWNGSNFRMVSDGEIERRAHKTAKRMVNEALGEGDLALVGRVAKRMGQQNTTKNMIERASVLEGIDTQLEDLDAYPDLLGTPMGTVDLREGVVREPRRSDLITKATSVGIPPGSELPSCPTWLRCLREDWLEGEEEEGAFRRIVGYAALGGRNRERLEVFVSGPTSTGKSTALGTIKWVLGDYAREIRNEVLLLRRSSGDTTPDLASLVGVRMAVTGRCEDGSHGRGQRHPSIGRRRFEGPYEGDGGHSGKTPLQRTL